MGAFFITHSAYLETAVQVLKEISIAPKEALKVVQITDMHLFADKMQQLHGHCTYQNLAETIDCLLAAKEEPHFILVTGDISQDESAESCQLAREQFERLNAAVYWIHGNHDAENIVKPIFEPSSRLQQLQHLTTPSWDFISINTCRRGMDSGYLEASELVSFWRRAEVAKSNHKNIAVVMHHHPYPVATPLIDACMLQQADNFLEQVKQHPEIKLMMCGHVHGDYQIAYGKQMIEACPATSFQWKKGTSTLETEKRRGFKYFAFNADAYYASTIYL